MDIFVQAMISSLETLYSFSAWIGFPNYGIAIILLTIIIKILLYPLTYKQMFSMRKMVDLQPKMKAIQEKYKNNKEKANAAMMEFYKDNKINPMGGCLPLLIQLPIFYALYKALINFPYESIAAATFLYFDLTKSYGFGLSYHLILPLFAGVTTFLQTKLSNPNTTDPTQKTMLYIMPPPCRQVWPCIG